MSDAPRGPGWWQATDGRWYPPGNPQPMGAPPPGSYPGAPPPKSNAGAVVIGCLVAFVGLTLVAVICIAAVTLLGKNASSKFSAVAVPIDPPSTFRSNTPPTPVAPAAGGAGASISGTTPCPAADGSSPRTTSFAQAPPMCIDPAKTYQATVGTTKGAFTITLDAKQAPLAVNNFVVLSRYHFYDGVAFHRVIPDFVVQGGDATGVPAGTGGPGYTFPDELPSSPTAYKVGTVAMANAGPNTNGSQFYIVTSAGKLEAKYSVLGQVTEGYDTTVKSIEQGGSASGTPVDPTSITTVTITER